MKVTYSNSYDKSTKYAVDVNATDRDIKVTLYVDVPIYPDQFKPEDFIDGETINKRVWGGKKLLRYTTTVLNLDSVQNTPAWQDRSVWTGIGRFSTDGLVAKETNIKMWHNVTAETINNKIKPSNHFMQQLRTSPLDLGAFLLFVPFRDSSFSDCGFHILTKMDDIPHLYNGNPISPKQEIDPMQAQLAIMPRIAIDGPITIPEEGRASLDLRLLDANGKPLARDCDAYLETIGGYLPYERVRIVNGQAQARVIALGVERGEQIRVKTGFKFWRGDSDHSLMVVANEKS